MHLLNVIFYTPSGKRIAFCGYVTTRVYSPAKLYKAITGEVLPEFTEVIPFNPAFLSQGFTNPMHKKIPR